MQIGDLVRVKASVGGEHARANFPHMTEVGIIVGWSVYMPIVLYSTGTRTMANEAIEVVR